jgi:hypothetical protein
VAFDLSQANTCRLPGGFHKRARAGQRFGYGEFPVSPPHPIYRRPKEKKPELTERQKKARPNALRHAQVMPPHNVDLTLQPQTHQEVHVPAHVTGADLSREAPGDANHGNKGKRDSH